jgi:hypothetical protein
MKHSSLLGPFVCWEEIEALWITIICFHKTFFTNGPNKCYITLKLIGLLVPSVSEVMFILLMILCRIAQNLYLQKFWWRHTTRWPSVNVIKLFSSSLMFFTQKLQCMSTANPFIIVWHLQVWLVPTHSGSPFSCTLLALAPVNTHKNWTKLVRLVSDKHCNLYDLFISDKGEKYDNIDTRTDW